MSKCKCDLRTKLVGDGCEVCNPALALDMAKGELSLYAEDVERCWSHMPELRDTEHHYELHEAVSEVVRQRDELCVALRKIRVGLGELELSMIALLPK